MTNTALATAHQTWARSLWALCYRMTGVAADADELVQDTFVRALETRPAQSEGEPLQPWLFRVATRLCLDRLRRRKTQGYVGPWLPSPVPDEALVFEAPPSARYEMMESASVAFLLALEALSPEQRAAVVLGDVFDLPAREIGQLIEHSEANVRQLQHRARQLLSQYDEERVPLSAGHREQNLQLLQQFFAALAADDIDAARQVLSADVQVLNDGGGIYHAARVRIHGADRAVLFMRRLLALRGFPLSAEVRNLNGLWAVDLTMSCTSDQDAPRAVTGTLADAQGHIKLIYSVLAPEKLRLPTLNV